MKTLSLLALTAAFAAFALLPSVFEVTFSILFVGGIAAIMFADYSRAARRLPVAAVPVLACAARTRTERFGLAA